MKFDARSAPTAAPLAGEVWQPVREGKFAMEPADRVLQYRAVFASDNGERYPVLRRVAVELE